MLVPSNDRTWSPDQATLPYAVMRGDEVDVHNIRNCAYFSTDDYVLQHYDKTFRLDDLETVDFIVVPFTKNSRLAHTMLSFGFRGDEYLAVSVEIRKELGETYAAWKGSLRQYELMYVLGDERDLIRLRTNFRNDDVHVYRATAQPEDVQALFRDVLARVNKLHDEPEFYDTLTNNCTTNIMGHVNRLKPNRIPYTYHVLLPGLSDRLAYDLGLIDKSLPFRDTKERANVSRLARLAGDSPEFSAAIRR